MELDDLLRLIARESSSGAVAGDPRQQREWGLAVVRAWFRGLRSRICDKPEDFHSDVFEFMNDLALIIDIGASLQGNVPVSQLAVAAFKYGVRGLCAETT